MTEFGWVGLVGLLLPLAISLVKRPGWSKRGKQWFAFVAAVVAAAITEGVTVDWSFDPEAIFAAVAVILPASQATYHLILADSKAEELLGKV